MFWATVPKASVDEDGDAFGGEYDINFDAAPLEFDVTIFSETKS